MKTNQATTKKPADGTQSAPTRQCLGILTRQQISDTFRDGYRIADDDGTALCHGITRQGRPSWCYAAIYFPSL